MKNIGFTGTRFGMTDIQRMRVIVAHHGDCVGADAQFHDIVRVLPGSYIVVHPPVAQDDRAMCVGDETRPALPFMQRNRKIVDAADVMIATPREMTEQEYGGTWRTIDLARRRKKSLIIVWPDGTTTEERML